MIRVAQPETGMFFLKPAANGVAIWEVRHRTTGAFVALIRLVGDGFRTANRWKEFETFSTPEEAIGFATEGR